MRVLFNPFQSSNLRFKSRVVYEKSNTPLTEEERDFIDRFEEGKESFTKFLGEGVASRAYYSYAHDFVVKQNKENIWLPPKRRGQMGSLAHENNILLSIDDHVRTTQKGIAYVETLKGGEFLLSTFASGKPANIYSNPFTEKHIDRLLRALYRLDKCQIVHCDLSNPNLLLNDNNDVNIIDYQWAERFSYYWPFSNFELENSFFAPFEAPNNASLFEGAGLAGYVRKMSASNAEDFLRKYYMNKAHYTQKKVNKLEEISQKKFLGNAKNIIDFERKKTDAYNNINEDVLNVEVLKMNILNLHRRQNSCHDVNSIEPRNILRAIPLCLEAKYCADQLASYSPIYYKNLDYINYMNQVGKFWQEKFEKWYPSALEFIFNIISGYAKDPARIYFPDKLDDFSDLDIVKIKEPGFLSKLKHLDVSMQDLELRTVFKMNKDCGYSAMYKDIVPILKNAFKCK